MSRQHCDQAIQLYDPVEHRQLATRFGQDVRVTTLLYRSWALWVLGYPESSLVDAEEAVADAREIGQDATLIYSLLYASWADLNCGKYSTAETRLDEAVALAKHRGVSYWNAVGTMHRGWLSAVTGKHSDAVSAISSGIKAWRATGASLWTPFFLSCLALAHSQLDQPREAWRHIDEAVATMRETKETWLEAEINRIAGEIALRAPDLDTGKAEAYFNHALEIARMQEAKSLELRAATSLARLWYDRGERRKASELLAPVYGWFSEGLQTLDLKQAKGLLDELA